MACENCQSGEGNEGEAGKAKGRCQMSRGKRTRQEGGASKTEIDPGPENGLGSGESETLKPKTLKAKK